jgi:hypothetical protein
LAQGVLEQRQQVLEVALGIIQYLVHSPLMAVEVAVEILLVAELDKMVAQAVVALHHLKQAELVLKVAMVALEENNLQLKDRAAAVVVADLAEAMVVMVQQVPAQAAQVEQEHRLASQGLPLCMRVVAKVAIQVVVVLMLAQLIPALAVGVVLELLTLQALAVVQVWSLLGL